MNQARTHIKEMPEIHEKAGSIDAYIRKKFNDQNMKA